MSKKLLGMWTLAVVLSTHPFAEAQVTNPPVPFPPIEMPPPITALPTAISSWGADDHGQLGNREPLVNSQSPEAVALRDPTSVSAGYEHALALLADGTVWTWGDNYFDQMGGASHSTRCIVRRDGVPSLCPAPVRVPGLTGVTAISAGTSHSLALKSDHTVWAWGRAVGGLNATTERSAQPVEVSGLITVRTFPRLTFIYPIAVAAGFHYSLALKSDGSVWAWGTGEWGTLGQASIDNPTHPEPSATPVKVQGPDGIGFLTDIISIAAGGAHALALTADGRVFAWGRGHLGQLGDGLGETIRSTPVEVSIPGHVIAIAAGDAHSLALQSNGTVWAWGANYSGQLGDGSYDNHWSPVQVLTGFSWIREVFDYRKIPNPLENIVAIATGAKHSMALRADGRFVAWGKNGNQLENKQGLLGVGNFLDGSIPLASHMSVLTGVTAIAGGWDFSLAKTCSTFDTNPLACDPPRVATPIITPPPPPIVFSRP